MADETTPDTTTERKRYYYPVERTFTGLVQFRADAEEEVEATPSGTWRRGEVKAIKNPEFAQRLVSGGKHAHAPAGTPTGQPEEFRPKAATMAPITGGAAEGQPVTASGASMPVLVTNDMRLRLAEIGYTVSEIDAMTPQQAHEAIANGKKE